jgi:hypothetical protein
MLFRATGGRWRRARTVDHVIFATAEQQCRAVRRQHGKWATEVAVHSWIRVKTVAALAAAGFGLALGAAPAAAQYYYACPPGYYYSPAYGCVVNGPPVYYYAPPPPPPVIYPAPPLFGFGLSFGFGGHDHDWHGDNDWHGGGWHH